jgi:hypothetical protein
MTFCFARLLAQLALTVAIANVPLAADAGAPERVVHRYLSCRDVAGRRACRVVEGDASPSGGEPVIRALMIRTVDGKSSPRPWRCPAAPCANAGRRRSPGARTARRSPSRCASRAAMRAPSTRWRRRQPAHGNPRFQRHDHRSALWPRRHASPCWRSKAPTRKWAPRRPALPSRATSAVPCPSSASAFSMAASSLGIAGRHVRLSI